MTKRHDASTHSDSDLRQLALDFCSGMVYTTANVPVDIAHFVFMPLLFADDKTTESWKKHDVQHFYAHVKKHTPGPRAINGYPIFFEMVPLTRSEWTKFQSFIEEARKLRADFVGEKDGLQET